MTTASRMSVPIALCLTALAGGGALLTGVALGRIPVSAALFINCILSAVVLSAGLSRMKRAPSDSAPILLAGALSLLAGPFGAFVALLASLGPILPRSRLPASGGAEGALEPPDRIDALCSDLRNKRLRIEGASGVISLMDVMSGGSIPHRIDALTVMGRTWSPGFAPALQMARRDPDPSIRVLASTIIASLQSSYTRKIDGARQLTLGEPSLARNWIQLAEAHEAYAQSGVIESPSSRTDELECALEAADQAIRLHAREADTFALRRRVSSALQAILQHVDRDDTAGLPGSAQ